MGGISRQVLYVVRHCQAQGQEPSDPLTEQGKAQAEALCAFLARFDVERIVSSPFVRALESIRPLSARLGIPVEVDPRLQERTLSTVPLPDWYGQLCASCQDLDMAIGSGESSRAAMQRASAAVADVLSHPARRTVVVTHGNLMALMLKTFDDSVGFGLWERLTYPDVYTLTVRGEQSAIERVWTSAQWALL
jgi:2,3-bisphosphoglycerate-dependent phosphoglycerate mutase